MIAFMLVDCAFRRKGIGKKLLDVIIESNLDNALYTKTNDRTALAFYSHYNFKLDKTITCKGDKYLTLKLQR
jgi:ribosomal protein S18 acetylase RimI-like enzyme